MPTTSKFPFSAVLLAGGRSTRMGRDKASVEIEGEPLWHRQLGKLRAMEPAELFISGLAAGPYQGAGFEIVEDVQPSVGPMGGLAASLKRTSSEFLLVLAIDLPAMPSAFLTKLVATAAGSGTCVVPQWETGNCEPLAAIYRRDILPMVDGHLSEGRLSIQQIVRTLLNAGLARPYAIAPSEVQFFANLNTPSELAAYIAANTPPAR